METWNIRPDDADLSRLLDAAERGEDVVLARDGRPVAKLVPLAKRQRLIFGILAGETRIPDDFDAPLPDDVLDAFEGR